ncbi:hypothetical protein PTTG_11730 [Puccinia triticina 1-1 BBBD Race 1]|uniref:Mog1p/PsbP-like protein n=2 Tax=Puccinia triticina TaxID=208348 RepID=A0A180H4A4_PUCT1|nr:uncharacterized protein PtA15_2A432 [Puccinia triticina]OAV99624.1 hypothetical protein PTTG_11730 [Puccinia triticina 1-1 BBBD Race 1]WAQ82119.1 hypothetical protein PtA15_2A432 [Puccinia triticina]WAR52982.1 hypothetical protein PtB15_2B410 [Puccinia triticina]
MSTIPYKAKQVQLFGGAITIDLPPKIIDVSTFRQVPDSQEVFISTSSRDSSDEQLHQGARTTEDELTKDLSMIIEVLELVDLRNDPEYLQQNHPDDDDNDCDNHPKSIIKYHFDSLAHDNSSKLATIKSITMPKDRRQFTEPPATVAAQANDPPSDDESGMKTRRTPEPVKCYGLQSVAKFNEAESHDVHIWLALWRLNGIGNQGRGTDLVLTFNLPHLSSADPVHFQQSVEFTDQIFQQAARSLHIADWSLFA